MMIRSRYAAAAVALVTLVVSGAAHAQPSRPAQNANATQQQFNRVADALGALKTMRFMLTREGAPAFLDEKTGVTFTTADCGYVVPQRMSCDIKISLKNGTIVQVTRVWVPDGIFQSNPLTRQFVKLPGDPASPNGAILALNNIAEALRTGVRNGQTVGSETVRNQTALHLKGDVRGDTLKTMMPAAALQEDRMYPVDLWMDERSANPVQLRVTEAPGTGWLIELSNINETLTIPTPQVPPPAGSRPPA